jgi:hypothetical protein
MCLFSSFASYLVGFHMTIAGWRPGRDHEGWQLAKVLCKEPTSANDNWSQEEVETLNIPIGVRDVPRFKDDIIALTQLMSSDVPPLKRAQCKRRVKCYYGFSNTSGSGFGATIQIDDNPL